MENKIIDGFMLDTPTGEARKQTIGWLLLATGSLVLAGIFTVLVVFSRIPFVYDIIPWVDFFHTALVVHVDLTVLVWFISCAGIFWSLNRTPRCGGCGWAAFWLAVAGTGVIVVSPFLGAGAPLMNNYVPVLRDPIFFTGLGIFGLGFALLVVNGLVFSRATGMSISGDGALRFGLFTALIAALVSLAAFVASYVGIPAFAEGEYYYELLFWGSGHTLQFVHIQLMLVAWLWLATVAGVNPRLSPRVALILFALGLLPVLLTPLVYVAFDVGSANHLQAITWLMKYGGGLAAVPFGLVILYSLTYVTERPADHRHEYFALLSSMLLFGVGGVIGFMITDSNVRIPAHYHGSIVAVTIAFMGSIVHLLPRLGFRRPRGWWVTWQPVIYASGQLMHVLALAWTGGHGVQRKTAGAAQQLDGVEKVIGMGLMGLGGLIAMIGGLLFLVIVFKAVWPVKKGG